jgi:hypothetical protein
MPDLFDIDTAGAERLAEIGRTIGGELGDRFIFFSEELVSLEAEVMDILSFPDPDPIERERKAREGLARCARVRAETEALRRSLVLHTKRQVQVVAYDFEGERFCPKCMVTNLPTGEDEAFDGWALAEGAAPMDFDENLDEIAAAFGIKRDMDQMEFPVRVHRADLDGHQERCSACAGMFG